MRKLGKAVKWAVHRTSLVFLAPFLLHTWFCLHPHFLGCAFHGIHVLQRMLGTYCRMSSVFRASHSAFTQHWVGMTFADPVRIKLGQLQRLAWVLLTRPRLPEQEMEADPCNHTCPAYEVPVSWLRRGVRLCERCRGCCNTQLNKFAWKASQSSYIVYLQKDPPAKAAVLLNCCAALLLFVTCLAIL